MLNSTYVKTVFDYSIQMINCIEKFHSLGLVHCDVKPENFTLKDHNRQIVLIDFGLAHTYLNYEVKWYADYISNSFISNESKHIDYKDDDSFKGTPSFASINTLQKIH